MLHIHVDELAVTHISNSVFYFRENEPRVLCTVRRTGTIIRKVKKK